MYSNKFVLSIMHNDHPVKETGREGKKEVVVPFNSEYIIRLKNKNDRSCTARVFIDDKMVSQMGDFIIHAGETVNLERFVDKSMTDGKKFKFVPLTNEDVDDPTSSENGIIKVEFRKARQKNGITILPSEPWTVWPVQPNTLPPFTYRDNATWGSADWTYTSTNTNKSSGDPVQVMYCNSNIDSDLTNRCADTTVVDGATIEGGSSNQSFVYSNLDVEDNAVILQLKIVGIENKINVCDSAYKYCTQCGSKAKHMDKYCSKCGRKL